MSDVVPERVLSATAFYALRDLVAAETGIMLNDGKKNFMAARLQRRLRWLKLRSYDEYFAHVDAHQEELEHLINAITTNKTSFFREPHHFELLTRELVPAVVRRAEATGRRRVRIWSAGCSSGEEPYSIAMTLHAALPHPETWDVRILASDIDTEVLARATAGVYSAETVAQVPRHLREHYFEDLGDGQARVIQALRQMVVSRRINLNQPSWPVRTRFDAIFCRNVVIYFDQRAQRALFQRFATLLEPGAPLVLGHSETLHWLPDLFRHGTGTTYYVRQPDDPAPRPRQRPWTKTAEAMHTARRITVGQVFATRRPTAIRTLLGSCIAACLYDPVAKVGGMNHFLLPAGRDDEPTSARFGVHAMELLINAIMRQGGQRERLQAKIFGGAHVLETMSSSVPAKNIAFIREFLTTENIPLKAHLLGGETPLDVCMFTENGQVLARRVDNRAARTIAAEESRFAEKQLSDAPVAAESGIVLF